MDFRNSARPIWLSLVALLCSCSGQQTYDDGTDSLGSKKPRRETPEPAPVVVYDSGIDFTGTTGTDDAGLSGITEPIPPLQEVSADAAAWFGPYPEYDADALFNDLIAADGRFVALGDGRYTKETDGESRIYTSTDGQNWTLVYDEPGGVISVAYGAGVWVAVGVAVLFSETIQRTYTTPLVLRSTDGVEWTPVPEDKRPFDANVDQVVFTGSGFIARADNQLLRSTDGSEWVEVTDAPSPVYRLAETDSLVFGIASDELYFSDDQGDSWTLRALPENVMEVTDVWQATDGIVGMGQNICCFGEVPEQNKYYEMHQGAGGTWTTIELAWDAFHPRRPIQVGDLTVARGTYSSLGYRNAGEDWIEVPAEELGYNSIYALAENNGVFVATGAGALRWSTDGKEWHPATVVE